MAPRAESAIDVERWLREQSAALWPAALGSLSLRRSPCVRENCPAEWLVVYISGTFAFGVVRFDMSELGPEL